VTLCDSVFCVLCIHGDLEGGRRIIDVRPWIIQNLKLVKTASAKGGEQWSKEVSFFPDNYFFLANDYFFIHSIIIFSLTIIIFWQHYYFLLATFIFFFSGNLIFTKHRSLMGCGSSRPSLSVPAVEVWWKRPCVCCNEGFEDEEDSLVLPSRKQGNEVKSSLSCCCLLFVFHVPTMYQS
jgi:hypothetical protein